MKINIDGILNPQSRASTARLTVAIAQTPTDLQHGLMFKKQLDEDEGMLFVFPRKQKLNFWGENTFIPLDIAFVDEQGVIRGIDRIAPMNRKVVSSGVPCMYAIEANDGFFKKHNVGVGDKIFLNSDSFDGKYLSFVKKRRNTEGDGRNFNNRAAVAQSLPVQQDKLQQPNAEQEFVDNQNLPVIDISQLGSLLEDDIENGQILDDNDQQGGSQQETPVDTNLEPEQPEFEYPKFGNAFDAVKWAEQNNETMRISYTTNKGTALIRDVEPHGSFHAKSTNRQILVTYDQTVGDIRAFIMTNIHAFSFVGERFDKKFRVS
jgi:uncharacterized membrane protein (UPF0127 family)